MKFDKHLEAMKMIERGYRDTAVRSFDPQVCKAFLAQKGNGPKTLRKLQRADSESYRFARGSRKALEQGGMEAMFEFQDNFKWRFNV